MLILDSTPSTELSRWDPSLHQELSSSLEPPASQIRGGPLPKPALLYMSDSRHIQNTTEPPTLSQDPPLQSWRLLHSLIFAPAQIHTQTSGLQSLSRTLPQGLNGSSLLCRTPLLPSLLPLPSSCIECPLVFSSSSHPLLLFLSGCGGPTLFSGFSSGFSESSWVSALCFCLVWSLLPMCLALLVCPSPPAPQFL